MEEITIKCEQCCQESGHFGDPDLRVHCADIDFDDLAEKVLESFDDEALLSRIEDIDSVIGMLEDRGYTVTKED